MPRKVMAVAAKTVLWSATGKPSSEQVLMAVARCVLVVSVPGGRRRGVIEVVDKSSGSVAHDSPGDSVGHRREDFGCGP